MNVYLPESTNEQMQLLYTQGLSAREIKEELDLTLSIRQIQRRLKKLGIIRTSVDAFRLAVANGKVTYHKNPNKIARKAVSLKMRMKILERDDYRCVLCGAGSGFTRLQVDHVDNNKNNNVEDNLQTLCEECNHGKYLIYKDGLLNSGTSILESA